MARPSYRFALRPPWSELPRVTAWVGTPLALDYHVASYETPLTLKSVPRGVATYTTPRSRYRLDARSCLILNDGQTYALDIDARDRTSTLCVFFEPGLLNDVANAMRRRGDRWLEVADAEVPSTFGVCERLHGKTGRLGRLLARARDGVFSSAPTEAALEAWTCALAREVVLLDARDRDAIRTLPGLRAATRAEAYKRLHWARDLLDSSFFEPLTIATLARVACMSSFHFHHLFKQAFGETPMQRVQRRRLEAAAAMLRGTDASVTNVCMGVGFASLGSFSSLFRRRYRMTPRAYREKSRNEEVSRRRAP